MNFAISADHRVKVKEKEKKGKFLDITKELKKLWNMVTVIRIIIGAFGTIPKRVVKGQEDLEI